MKPHLLAFLLHATMSTMAARSRLAVLLYLLTAVAFVLVRRVDSRLPDDWPMTIHCTQPTHCVKCDRQRPCGTRHCSVSRTCIYGFDHYCPWIDTTVGDLNYRAYLGFLALAAALFAVCLANSAHADLRALHAVALGFLLYLGVFHAALVCRGQTTWSYYFDKRAVAPGRTARCLLCAASSTHRCVRRPSTRETA